MAALRCGHKRACRYAILGCSKQSPPVRCAIISRSSTPSPCTSTASAVAPFNYTEGYALSFSARRISHVTAWPSKRKEWRAQDKALLLRRLQTRPSSTPAAESELYRHGAFTDADKVVPCRLAADSPCSTPPLCRLQRRRSNPYAGPLSRAAHNTPD